MTDHDTRAQMIESAEATPADKTLLFNPRYKRLTSFGRKRDDISVGSSCSALNGTENMNWSGKTRIALRIRSTYSKCCQTVRTKREQLTSASTYAKWVERRRKGSCIHV